MIMCKLMQCILSCVSTRDDFPSKLHIYFKNQYTSANIPTKLMYKYRVDCYVLYSIHTCNKLHIETVSRVGNRISGEGFTRRVNEHWERFTHRGRMSGQDERRERGLSIGINVYHGQCPCRPPQISLPSVIENNTKALEMCLIPLSPKENHNQYKSCMNP